MKESQIKPTKKSVVALVAILMTLLLFGLVSFLFSYPAYHREIYFDYDNATALYPYNIEDLIRYREVPSGLMAYEYDPQIIITPPDHVVASVRVVLRNPLERGHKVQVYFAENHEDLTEENSEIAFFNAGSSELDINIYGGTREVFTTLRIDIDIFDEPFVIYGIYASSSPLLWSRTWVGNNDWWPLTIVLCVLAIGLWLVYVLRCCPDGVCDNIKKLPLALWVFVAVIVILFMFYYHDSVLPIAERPLVTATIVDNFAEHDEEGENASEEIVVELDETEQEVEQLFTIGELTEGRREEVSLSGEGYVTQFRLWFAGNDSDEYITETADVTQDGTKDDGELYQGLLVVSLYVNDEAISQTLVDYSSALLSSARIFAVPKDVNLSQGCTATIALTVIEGREGESITALGNADGELLYSVTFTEAIYGGTRFLISAYWFFAIFLILGLIMTAYLLYVKDIAIEKAFLIVASLIGFVYLFLTFNSTPDASVHFQTSYAYSNVFLGHPVHSARTIDPDPARWAHNMQDPNHNWQVGLSDYIKMHDSLFENVGNYEIIEWGLRILRREHLTFIPPALGIAAARLLNASSTMLYFAASLFGMIFFIAGTFFAIKIIPLGKMVLFCVALFPTTMNQAASYNPDNVINVMAFLFIAMVFYLANKVAQEEKIRTIEIIFLCAICITLITMKGGVYLPFVGLLLLIHFKRKRGTKLTKSRLLLYFGVFAVVLVPFLAIRLRDIIISVPGGHIVGLERVPGWTLSNILLNPGETWHLIVSTLVGLGESHLLQAVGIGMSWPSYILPIEHISIFFFFIILAILSVQNMSLTVRQRLIIGIVASASVSLVYFAMLMVWTPYPANRVSGVQGRYITSALPLVFLVFAGIPWMRLKYDITKGIITALFCLQMLVMVNYFVIVISR